MKNILIVVLYKRTVSNSLTITTFCDKCSKFHNKVSLHIWDNSPYNENDFSYLRKLGIEYKYTHSPENLSLAKIYNKVISTTYSDQIVHIFDQDSNLTELYFDLMYKAINDEPNVYLFVPYVLYGDKLLSPGKYKYYKGSYNKKLLLGKIFSKNTICITSGMTMRAILREKVKFDENLNLYGIDSMFLLDYSAEYKYLYVINYSLSHNLSQFEIEPIDVKIKRFESFITSSRYIALKHSGVIAFVVCYITTSIKFLLFKIKFILNKSTSK